MSNFRFGDDYELNYYPAEASDGMGGVDWDKVEFVEIEGDVYVKERTCKREKHGRKMDGSWRMRCSECGYGIGDKRWAYCPNCGAKVRDE